VFRSNHFRKERFFTDNAKYFGMDVHIETISIAVLNSAGKLAMESAIETKALINLDSWQVGIPQVPVTVRGLGT